MNSGPVNPLTLPMLGKNEPARRDAGNASTPALDLFSATTVPVARRSDPWTSREAARSVQNIAQAQEDVLALLRRHGPGTDEEIASRHASAVSLGVMRRQSPSGLRTRRAELVERGLIVSDGRTRPTVSGRNSIVWRVA